MEYDNIMRLAFPFAIIGDPEQIRSLAVWLTNTEPAFPTGGSSFAVTTRPQWTLWLSEASLKRLRQQEPRLIDIVRRTAFFNGTVEADFYFTDKGSDG